MIVLIALRFLLFLVRLLRKRPVLALLLKVTQTLLMAPSKTDDFTLIPYLLPNFSPSTKNQWELVTEVVAQACEYH